MTADPDVLVFNDVVDPIAFGGAPVGPLDVSAFESIWVHLSVLGGIAAADVRWDFAWSDDTTNYQVESYIISKNGGELRFVRRCIAPRLQILNMSSDAEPLVLGLSHRVPRRDGPHTPRFGVLAEGSATLAVGASQTWGLDTIGYCGPARARVAGATGGGAMVRGELTTLGTPGGFYDAVVHANPHTPWSTLIGDVLIPPEPTQIRLTNVHGASQQVSWRLTSLYGAT